MSRLKKAGALTAAGAAAVALLFQLEGVRTKPYYDSVGVLTVCVGETQGVKRTDSYTVEQCRAMLVRRLDPYEAGVRKCLKNPDGIPAGAYVAAISFAYNIGTAGFCGSSIRRRLDAGDIRGACDSFRLYTKARGQYLKGLAYRREIERKVCLGEIK